MAGRAVPIRPAWERTGSDDAVRRGADHRIVVGAIIVIRILVQIHQGVF
jgi:hypothetical protein